VVGRAGSVDIDGWCDRHTPPLRGPAARPVGPTAPRGRPPGARPLVSANAGDAGARRAAGAPATSRPRPPPRSRRRCSHPSEVPCRRDR
jgi:hypothetical protein